MVTGGGKGRGGSMKLDIYRQTLFMFSSLLLLISESLGDIGGFFFHGKEPLELVLVVLCTERKGREGEGEGEKRTFKIYHYPHPHHPFSGFSSSPFLSFYHYRYLLSGLSIEDGP